jgi:hypothetical protein
MLARRHSGTTTLPTTLAVVDVSGKWHAAPASADAENVLRFQLAVDDIFRAARAAVVFGAQP